MKDSTDPEINRPYISTILIFIPASESFDVGLMYMVTKKSPFHSEEI